MTIKPEAINAMTAQPISSTTQPDAIKAPDLTPAAAWSRRVRRIGGFIQAAFAAFWLGRASLAIGGRAGDILLAASAVAVTGVFAYALRVTACTAPRPAGRHARRIERSVTAATVIELAAAFILPVIVIAATLQRACRMRASNENLPPIVRSHGTIHKVPAATPSSSCKRSRSSPISGPASSPNTARMITLSAICCILGWI